MDSGVETTQRIVIAAAIFLGVAIVLTIGYSLYVKASRAELELANKIDLDNSTSRTGTDANISLTGESRNNSGFSYDGLVQRKPEEATTTKFEIVNEEAPTEVEEEIIPEEEPVPPEENILPAPKPTPRVTTPVDDDRPLTQEEIEAIRRLPIDDSPSGNLQTALEEESQGQYKARY